MKFATLIFVLFLSIAGSSGYAQTINKQTGAESKAITVNKNSPEFTIEMPANPTTGYMWYLAEYDRNLIEPVKHDYRAPDNHRVGAGGVDIWTFKAKPEFFTVPNIASIRFVYAQAWNLAAAQRKTVKVVSS